jgi:hypothetical protein
MFFWIRIAVMKSEYRKNSSLFFAVLFLLAALMENQFLGVTGEAPPPVQSLALVKSGGSDYAGEPARENHEFFAAAPWGARWSMITAQRGVVSYRNSTVYHTLFCSICPMERRTGKGDVGNIIPLTLRI